MLIGIFYSLIVESSSLVSVPFREAISHPYISFFSFTSAVNDFSVIIIILIIIKSFRRVFSECTETVATSHTVVTNFPEICAFIIGYSSTKKYGTSKRMLTKFVSIGSYSPEVRTFGTLLTSAIVFSLIICKDI